MHHLHGATKMQQCTNKRIHVPTPTRSPAFTLNVNFFSVKGRPFRYLQTNKTETRSVSNINRSNDKYQCHSHRDPSPSFPSTNVFWKWREHPTAASYRVHLPVVQVLHGDLAVGRPIGVGGQQINGVFLVGFLWDRFAATKESEIRGMPRK